MGPRTEARRLGRFVSSLRLLKPLRALIIIIGAEVLASAIFIFYFCRAFKISLLLIAVHLPLVTGLLVASLLVPGMLLHIRWVRTREATKYWLATSLGATFSLLAILYAADYASYFWTGFHLNYKLIHLYFWDLRHGSDLVSLSPSIYLFVLVFVTLVAAFHLACAGPIFRGLQALLLPSQPASLFKNRRRAVKSGLVIVLLILAYSVDFYLLLRRAPYSELLSSDPFLSFVRSTTEVYDANYPAFASKLRQEDQQCRSAYPRAQNFNKKNVILIMVDALRADHMQVYGYRRATTPFLQNLAQTGHLRKVEFATSTCAATYCGVMSTLASRGVKQLIPGNFKLSDLLSDEGYRTYLLLSGSHDVQGLKEAYGRDVTLYFDGLSSQRYSSEDDRIIFEGLDLVPNYSGTPAFFHIHLMSVHLIGVKHASFNVYQPAADRHDFRAMFRGESGHWPQIINSYDNSVMQADATIKQIFGALEQKGYLRNSVVVILADHGEGLGERPKHGWGHGRLLYSEFIQIPLLIYDESPVQYPNLKVATQIDVAPTIVDRLGLTIPDCWRGTSLLQPDLRTVTTYQTGLSRPCHAVLYRTDAAMYKYIYCYIGKTEELYNLTTDPKEQLNLIQTADSAVLQRVRDELQRSRE